MMNRFRVSLVYDAVELSAERKCLCAGIFEEFASLDDALNFLDARPIYKGFGRFRKYEIRIEFSNGNKVEASLTAKDKAREFLRFSSTQ